jgi:hypothetical protein|tara:strand:- start:530 stop:670 length:141 start_codon:yes stop_codon:yes gene_type:complete
MIKNLIFIMLLSLVIVSCGKKGCPMDPNNSKGINKTKKCDPVFKLS